MEFVIVTGMSGAGKSAALKILEDLDFFCVDNLPPLLIPKFAELCFKPGSDIEKVAFGIDIRGGSLFSDLFKTLDILEIEYKIFFLDAKDSVLLKRYKETRRRHPLSMSDSITNVIKKERSILQEIKQRATCVIDTSYTLPKELKEHMHNIFLNNSPLENLTVTILSFGFKNGIPIDADFVFDVRFIPNPFYIEELRNKTGNDKIVQDYVMNHSIATTFLKMLTEMIDYVIPYFIKEDKYHLIIAIGCTGGKHRSVTISNKLHDHLSAKGHNVVINHRDINNPK